MIDRRVQCALAVLALAACAKKEPEVKPTPVQQAVEQAQAMTAEVEAQTGGEVRSFTVRYVEVSEKDYIDLVVSAAGWARKSVRSLGVLQQTNGSPFWQHASEAATQRYSLRPIQMNDYSVVCGVPEKQQTSITQQKTVCTMKYVEAVMQFNHVRMTRDSGYVALGITRVPTGQSRAETVYQCVTLARKSGEWDARRGERIVDPTRCPKP